MQSITNRSFTLDGVTERVFRLDTNGYILDNRGSGSPSTTTFSTLDNLDDGDVVDVVRTVAGSNFVELIVINEGEDSDSDDGDQDETDAPQDEFETIEEGLNAVADAAARDNTSDFDTALRGLLAFSSTPVNVYPEDVNAYLTAYNTLSGNVNLSAIRQAVQGVNDGLNSNLTISSTEGNLGTVLEGSSLEFEGNFGRILNSSDVNVTIAELEAEDYTAEVEFDFEDLSYEATVTLSDEVVAGEYTVSVSVTDADSAASDVAPVNATFNYITGASQLAAFLETPNAENMTTLNNLTGIDFNTEAYQEIADNRLASVFSDIERNVTSETTVEELKVQFDNAVAFRTATQNAVAATSGESTPLASEVLSNFVNEVDDISDDFVISNDGRTIDVHLADIQALIDGLLANEAELDYELTADYSAGFRTILQEVNGVVNQ
ncbi:hypothetical protein JCM19037_1249 [Geomicrobium sp. JCM 19037]|nr:hypothetical protein JCM19037_1249 [Geomicrobium sp. JCM 19037]